jgi:hypothetical protein
MVGAMVRLVLLVGILVAACGGHPTTVVVGDFPHRDDVTLKAGDPGGMTIDAGRYRVTWSGSGCTAVFVEWAPTSDDVDPIEVTKDSTAPGSAEVSLPAGPGYLNRGGDCSTTVTLTRE